VRREVEELVASVPHDQSPAYYDGISGEFCLTGGCKSADDLKREAEERRQEELKRLEELNRLRTVAEKAIKEIEEAERAAREARNRAELAEKAAQDAEALVGGRSGASPTDNVKELPVKQEPIDPSAERAKLSKQIQEQLQRLGCYSGPIDGVWGDKVKNALTSFNESTKFNVPRDGPTQTALTVLSGRTEAACGIEATPEQHARPPAKPARPNPLAYSNRIWAAGSVQDGATVSTTTPYGHLTCTGGNFSTGKLRVCQWD
jgi:Putative peptidoglycan binding domain